MASSGTTSLLVGSHGAWPNPTIQIDGNDEVITAASTGLYPYHTTAALSAFSLLKTAAELHVAGTITVEFLQSGLVKISHDSGNFAINWSSGGALQTMLGFTQGNLSGAASYTAAKLSPYIWLPGRTETPRGRLGSQGRLIVDTPGGTSRDGTPGGRVLGTQYVERLVFPRVEVARYHDTTDEDRYLVGWWKTVGARRRLWFHWRQVTWDDSSSSSMTLSTGLGPYVCDLENGGEIPGTRSAETRSVEKYYTVPIACHIAPEYT